MDGRFRVKGAMQDAATGPRTPAVKALPGVRTIVRMSGSKGSDMRTIVRTPGNLSIVLTGASGGAGMTDGPRDRDPRLLPSELCLRLAERGDFPVILLHEGVLHERGVAVQIEQEQRRLQQEAQGDRAA